MKKAQGLRVGLLAGFAVVIYVGGLAAQRENPPTTASGMLDESTSSVGPLIERYAEDRVTVSHVYNTPLSETAEQRWERFYREWSVELAHLNFSSLDQESQIDYLLFDNHLEYQQRQLELRRKQEVEMAVLLPFARTIVSLDEARVRKEIPRPEEQAAALAKMVTEIANVRKAAEAGITDNNKPAAKADPDLRPLRVKATVASRTASTIEKLRECLRRWFQYYSGYDPLFTWWVNQPYKDADKALEAYGNFVKEKLVGIKTDDKTTIIGDPVGARSTECGARSCDDSLHAGGIDRAGEERNGVVHERNAAGLTRHGIRRRLA